MGVPFRVAAGAYTSGTGTTFPAQTFGMATVAGDLLIVYYCVPDNSGSYFPGVIRAPTNVITHQGNGVVGAAGQAESCTLYVGWENCDGGETYFDSLHVFSGSMVFRVWWELWRGTDGGGPHNSLGSDNTIEDNSTDGTTDHTCPSITIPASNSLGVAFCAGMETAGAVLTAHDGDTWLSYNTATNYWQPTSYVVSDGASFYTSMGSMLNQTDTGVTVGPEYNFSGSVRAVGVSFWLGWDEVTIPPGGGGGSGGDNGGQSAGFGGNLLASI